MNDLLSNSIYFGFALSLGFYWISAWISSKFKSSLMNPLFMTCVFIIITLFVLKIDYATFDNGAKYLTYLLTPTTVCLAVPMYKQFEILKENILAIFAGLVAGCVSCAITILSLCIILKVDPTIYKSLLPKSITTAIAMGVSDEIGGIVSVTVLSVMITGILGSMLASSIFKIFRIMDPIAQGLACGNASHAIGTARAFELGEIQGAMSSLSIVVAGILTVIIAPFMAMFL